MIPASLRARPAGRKPIGLLLASSLLMAAAGCARQADEPCANAKTVSEQLVGHWVSDLGDHLYFGPIRGDDEFGHFTLVQASRPEHAFTHRYEVLAEGRDGDSVQVRMWFVSGRTEARRYSVQAGGQRLTCNDVSPSLHTEIEVSYTRVDDRVEPERRGDGQAAAE